MGSGSWAKLLSHSHYFTLTLGDRSICVCARCSGVTLGFLISITILRIIGVQIVRSIPMEYLLLTSISLALPAIVDWITQSLGVRKSTNPLRLVTGVCEGVGVAFLAVMTLPFVYKIGVLCYIGAVVVFIGKNSDLWPK